MRKDKQNKQEEVMVRLGTTIRFLRGGMSLRELAEKADVPHSNLFRLEAGITKDPPLFLMQKIARYFNLTVDELMNFDAKVCSTCGGRGWVKGK
jgi:transcriptional regulator with XRE-family HTH domain